MDQTLLLEDLMKFEQLQIESLDDAWTRMEKMAKPIVEKPSACAYMRWFYNGLKEPTRNHFDGVLVQQLLWKNSDEAFRLMSEAMKEQRGEKVESRMGDELRRQWEESTYSTTKTPKSWKPESGATRRAPLVEDERRSSPLNNSSERRSSSPRAPLVSPVSEYSGSSIQIISGGQAGRTLNDTSKEQDYEEEIQKDNKSTSEAANDPKIINKTKLYDHTHEMRTFKQREEDCIFDSWERMKEIRSNLEIEDEEDESQCLNFFYFGLDDYARKALDKAAYGNFLTQTVKIRNRVLDEGWYEAELEEEQVEREDPLEHTLRWVDEVRKGDELPDWKRIQQQCALLDMIMYFNQKIGEHIGSAWERINLAYDHCTVHKLDRSGLIDKFYRGINQEDKKMLDEAMGERLTKAEANRVYEFMDKRLYKRHEEERDKRWQWIIEQKKLLVDKIKDFEMEREKRSRQEDQEENQGSPKRTSTNLRVDTSPPT